MIVRLVNFNVSVNIRLLRLVLSLRRFGGVQRFFSHTAFAEASGPLFRSANLASMRLMVVPLENVTAGLRQRGMKGNPNQDAQYCKPRRNRSIYTVRLAAEHF